MANRYDHRSINEFSQNSEKPGQRFEISPAIGIETYNLNVAWLNSGECLSQNAYHYHDDQSEFYYLIEGRCRVEVDDGSFDMVPNDVLRFDTGVAHLLHNPFEEQCQLIAIGAPPEGRYPVHEIQSYKELLAERYENDG